MIASFIICALDTTYDTITHYLNKTRFNIHYNKHCLLIENTPIYYKWKES